MNLLKLSSRSEQLHVLLLFTMVVLFEAQEARSAITETYSTGRNPKLLQEGLDHIIFNQSFYLGKDPLGITTELGIGNIQWK